MSREEIALLVTCHVLQYLAEGSPWPVPAKWREVGEASREMCIHQHVARRIFDKWEEKGWLDGKFEAPWRCGLSQAGNRAAQAVMCWHPEYGRRPVFGK